MSKFPPYVCTLDAATQKKALDELYEDPKNRQGAIDTFREWILQQKHIKCPLDDIFLLAFLRAKHFSQLEAREALERFMTLRGKFPEWMMNLDTTDKEIIRMLEKAILIYLPGLDSEGHRVGIFRPAKLDGGNKKDVLAYSQLFTALSYHNYFMDEYCQVHGSISLGDWTGHNMAKEMKMPLDAKKNFTTILTKAFPARVKGLHMYNAGNLIEFLMNLISGMLDDKLKKRIHVHSNLESVYKVIPVDILPAEYLPDDYKGNGAGTEKQLIADFKALITKPEVRERIKYLSSDEFFINVKEKDADVPAASFRKLNVD